MKESLNMTKELSYVILEPHNVRMERLNMRKKKVRQPPSERKKIVTCDVGTTQNKDGTVKCEKKVREPPNVRKELSHVILKLHNVRMKPSNVRKKKVREPPHVRKKMSHVILELHNVKMKPSNMRKK